MVMTDDIFCQKVTKESTKEDKQMDKYFCNPCGYTYDPEKGDPEHGIAPCFAVRPVAHVLLGLSIYDSAKLRYIF